jgi:glycosyltransferase involved in cell wall biosynthesis
MKIACVIPAHNESATISSAVSEFGEALSEYGDITTFVVNDNSTDCTGDLAREAGAQVIDLAPEQGRGLANAFRIGMAACLAMEADKIVHVDADMQYSPEDVPALMKASGIGRLVVGNRLWQQPEGMSELRYRWNQHLSELVGIIAGKHITDGQSGFRVFGPEIAELPVISQFTYTQEQIVRTGRSGFDIIQPDITFSPRTSGKSRLMRSPLEYVSRTTAELDIVAKDVGIDLAELEHKRDEK